MEIDIKNISDIDINISDIDINNLDDSLLKHVGSKLEDSEHLYTKPYSYWNTVVKKAFTNPIFLVCSFLIIIFVILSASIAIGLPAIPGDVPVGTPANEPPSLEHWFGTGANSEDMWNKLWIGSRTTLIFAMIIFAIQVVVGLLIGAIWGYYSRLDVVFIEIVRFISIIPSLILLIVVIFLFSKGQRPSTGVVIFAVSITSWIGLASIIRIQIMLTKNAEYNIASKVLGSRGPKIIKNNILPKILPIIIQTCAFAIPEAIAIDSSLAYLGFGFVKTQDQASLGSILNDVFAETAWQSLPHLLIIPMGFVGGLSLAFYLMGKVLADSLDPKNHR
ncbi:oligopeptide ABC transporter permease OppC [Mesoplasma corruscae]|uniref:Oligopeptide ABC transporter permease n=1 Tax=Mesoplasma corruscae TaxID=216874 RepID=A0A2S5RHQ4_9MOLU|nr:oligopeptide ABC transporter permease OppC [Mesoplasma corruscae]PPE06840.1 oligopeptide ABC transporter permease [Mesoplasma corruscae]